MKKILFVFVVLALLLTGCDHVYEVLGYCEEDGLYYYTVDGGLASTDNPKKYHKHFKGHYWCPPAPPEPAAGAEPLFRMWLLTNEDRMCMLVSETHPSVERQQILCGWVATNAPCADYVYDDDTWGCDSFGGSRLPLRGPGRDLMEVWNMHKARDE